MNKFLILSLILAALTGCAEQKTVIENDELRNVVTSLRIKVQKKDFEVNRVRVSQQDDIYSLVFSNYTEADTGNDTPSGYSYGLTMNEQAFNTVINLLKNPSNKAVELRGQAALGYYFTQYSTESEKVTTGLSSSPYYGQIAISNSSYYVGEHHFQVSRKEAPTLAHQLHKMLDEVK